MVKKYFKIKWISFFAGEAIATWLWPAIVPMVTFLIGWFGNFPWFYLWIGSVATFAFSVHALVRFGDWKTVNNLNDRVVFDSVRFGKSVNKDGNVTHFRFGIQIKNNSVFDISFGVVEMRSSFMECHSPNKRRKNEIYHVGSQNYGWADDFNIEIPNKIGFGTYEGSIECVIKFGRGDNLKYQKAIYQKILVSFDENGQVNTWEWHQA